MRQREALEAHGFRAGWRRFVGGKRGESGALTTAQSPAASTPSVNVVSETASVSGVSVATTASTVVWASNSSATLLNHGGAGPVSCASGNPAASPSRPLTPLAGDGSLWDRAYDEVKARDDKLVLKYERLLSSYLERGVTPGNESQATLVQEDTPNQIKTQPEERREQMQSVIALIKEDQKTSVTAQQVIGQTANVVLLAKDWIGEAISVSPEASMVWSGVSLVLSLLTNPMAEQQYHREGFVYVTSRLSYYSAFEACLFPERRAGDGRVDLPDPVKHELSAGIRRMYGYIVEFEIRCVMRFLRSSVETFGRDMIKVDDWAGLLSTIKTMEVDMARDIEQATSISIRDELAALVSRSAASVELQQKLLLAAERSLELSTSQLQQGQKQNEIARDQLFVAKKQLEVSQDAAERALEQAEKDCIQLFCKGQSDYKQFKDKIDERVEGTCQWLLQHPHYLEWLENASGPLLVSADPGCGKSVLAKYLIDSALPEVAPEATVCYFFFQDLVQNTLRQALCAILHQIFSKAPALVKSAMQFYDNMGAALVDSSSALWDVLETATHIPEAPETIIVLDGLDECDESDLRYLSRRMERLFSVPDPTRRLRFLMTGRPYDNVIAGFKGLHQYFPDIRIPGEDELEVIGLEINAVIKQRVKVLGHELDLSSKLQELLESRLLEVKHRTYLWVYLVFDYLRNHTFKRTAKGLGSSLDKLPKNVEETYDKILEKSEDKEKLYRVFCILLAAGRPLTLSEMNIAFNMDPDCQFSEELDLEGDADFKRSLRQTCGLFISIFGGKVYFLHQTAKEFLSRSIAPGSGNGPHPAEIEAAEPFKFSPDSEELRSRPRWGQSITSLEAHFVLAKCCLTYLTFDDVYSFGEQLKALQETQKRDHTTSPEEWALKPQEEDETTCLEHEDWSKAYVELYDKEKEKFPFLHYAIQYWDHHVQQSLNRDLQLDPRCAVVCNPSYGTSWVWLVGRVATFDMSALPNDFTLLALSSSLGFSKAVKVLIGNGADPNERAHPQGITPLWAATVNGHIKVARYLLRHGADPNIELFGKQSLLARVVREQNMETMLELVPYLLEYGADPSLPNLEGQTPAHIAVERRDHPTLRLLLDYQANVNATDPNGRTPLHLAQDEKTVATLLDRGATVDVRDSSGRTPLFTIRNRASLKRLIDAGADIHMVDNLGENVLHSAWSAESVEFFVSLGCTLDQADANKDTPLHTNCRKRNWQVAFALLDHGANINAHGEYGWTPLHIACVGNHPSKAVILISRGADLEAVDDDNCTPLDYIAKWMGPEKEADLLDLDRAVEEKLGVDHHIVQLWKQKRPGL